MNAKQFSVALGEVDDKFITEALTYQYSKQASVNSKLSIFKRLNTTSKRIAAAVVAVMVLFSSAMSVEAIREPFIEMIKTFFSDHVELSFNGNKKYTIEEIYGFSVIPDDFELTLAITNGIAVFRDYENSEGHIISFSQMTTGNDTTVDVDNEHTTCETILINGVEVYVAWSNRDDDIVAAFWGADGYSFNLTYIGKIESDSLIDLIGRIQVVGTYAE